MRCALGTGVQTFALPIFSRSGAGFSGASAVHMNIFGLNPVVVFGTPEQRAKALPPLIKGEQKACFAVTEPDAGLDTTKLSTRAVREGDSYVVHGRKIRSEERRVGEECVSTGRSRGAP